ncbi:MAG TPA: transglutaminase domain-containing protein [Micromonosporaceae bacterium]|jgi:transglutaminase-like putative cysteine protease
MKGNSGPALIGWGATLWAAVLLGLGALGLSAGWSGPAAAVLAAAAIVPVLVFSLGARLRVPTPVTALVVLGLAAAATYLFVIVPSGTGVATAMRDAVPRLLTARRPAPATAEFLLPGVVTALLVGVWVALRTVGGPPAPHDRTVGVRGRGLVAAPVGAVALYTGGTLLTAGTGDRTGLIAGAIVAVSAVGWVGLERFRRIARRTASGRAGPAHWLRAVIGRPLTVALATGTVLALVISANPVGAFEPRNLVEPPQRTLDEASPLPELSAWHENEAEELFRVTPLDGQVPARVRLVTLSLYTGVAWSATAAYRPVGVVYPTTLPPGRARQTSAAEFTIANLRDVVWLPGLGYPIDISLSNVDCEAEGGSIALVDGSLHPGLRYRVVAERDAPTVEQISTAGVPPAQAAGPLLDLPRLPPAFAELARQITFGASTAFEEAAAIEREVGRRRFDPAAPVGSSYARLSKFLMEDEGSSPGAQVGSSEQFAAAFAVLARAVGLPTRVVLGFKPGPDGVVRGGDALAWPEVYFTDYGWYPFDPTPGTADPAAEEVKLQALDRLDEQARAIVVPPASTQPPIPTPTPPTPAPQVVPNRTVAAAPPPSGTSPLLLVAAALAIVMLSLLIVASARAARRARHRRAGARGAWSEVLDLLILMGLPVPRTRTAMDLALDLATVAPVPAAPTQPALVIAVAADRAAFGPPASAGSRHDEVWSALGAVRRAVRAAVPLRRRLLWTVDPRPLRRR